MRLEIVDARFSKVDSTIVRKLSNEQLTTRRDYFYYIIFKFFLRWSFCQQLDCFCYKFRTRSVFNVVELYSNLEVKFD